MLLLNRHGDPAPGGVGLIQPASKVCGYPRQRFLKNPQFFNTLIHPGDQPRFAKILQTARQRGTATWSYRLRQADGRYHWWYEELRLSPNVKEPGTQWIACAGKTTGRVASAGVRARVRERLAGYLLGLGALAEAESPLRMLVEHSPLAMGLVNRAGEILYANPTLRRLYGERMAAARTVAEFIAAANPDAVAQQRALKYWQELVAAVQAGSEPEPYAAQLMGVAGCRDVLFRVILAGDLIVAILEDVTELKQTEALLRQGEERLSSALRGADDGLWDWVLATNEVYYSARWKAMLGYAEDELENHIQTWERLVNPEDHDRVLRLASNFAAGLIPKYEVEFQMRHRAGHWVDVLARASLIRDESGRPIRMVGTHVDISARKAVQAELEQRVQERTAELEAERARLEALFKAAPAGIVIHGAEGQILLCNPSAQTILGLNGTAAEGKAPEDFSQQFLREDGTVMPLEEFPVVQVLARRQRVAGQIVGLQRGQPAGPLWVYLNAEPRLDSAGGVVEVVVSFMDITARKLAETALVESAEFTRGLISCMQEGFSVLDTQGVALDVNPAFCQMTGFARTELVGVGPPHPYWPPEEFASIQAALARTLQGDVTDLEMVFMRRNGERFPVIVSPFAVKNRAGEIVSYSATIKDLTARRRREAALRESESKYRLLIEGMMDAFASVDLNGRITESNPVFQAMLGYSAAELRGLTFYDFTPAKWHGIEDRIRQEQVMARGYSDVYEKEYRRRDGTVFPVELRTFLLRNADGEPVGMWGIVRDITARKQIEHDLRELNATLEQRVARRTESLRVSEQRFRILAEATFEGVVLSRRGRILDCNEQLLRMMKASREQVVGQSVLDFVSPEWRDQVSQRIQQGVETRMEHGIICGDGSTCMVELRAYSPDGPDGVRISVLRDITERKAMEQIQGELETQRRDLVRFQRLAELTEVSTGVIHQIGQPFTAIINNISAAKTMVSRCTHQHCHAGATLQDTDASLTLVQSTMQRLQALTHPERARREPRDLNTLVGEVLQLIQAEANSLQIEVRSRLAPGLPPAALDEVQFGQALLNLLRNGCEAVASCEAARRVVTVKTSAGEPGTLILEVSDLGVGIAPADLSQLFEPFFTTKLNGTGVGLRLCRTIVLAHGGQLTGRNNEPGPGASFRIVLPTTAGGGL